MSCEGQGGIDDATATVKVIEAPTPPAPAIRFEVGTPMEMWRTDHVLSVPGGASAGLQQVGSVGVIIGGPTEASNTYWFQIDFHNGVDGWVRDTSMIN